MLFEPASARLDAVPVVYRLVDTRRRIDTAAGLIHLGHVFGTLFHVLPGLLILALQPCSPQETILRRIQGDDAITPLSQAREEVRLHELLPGPIPGLMGLFH